MRGSVAILLCLSILGCDGAPLTLRTFAKGNPDDGLLVAELEYLLREGSYCSLILLGDRETDSKESLEIYEGNVALSYIVEIPSTNYFQEVDLGKFDPNDLGFLHTGGFSYHQFTLSVKDIPKYRAKVRTRLVVSGPQELLESGEFGVQFSEWQCK